MKNILAIFALFALIGLAFAQGPSEELKKNVLKMQYEKVACRVEFYNSALSTLADKVNGTADDEIETLNNDLANLKSAADSGDRSAYNSVLHALSNDMKENVRVYKELFHDLSGPERKEFRNEFVAERKNLAECIRKSSFSLGEAQSNYVRAWIKNGKNITDGLENKGLDVTNLTRILNEAEGKFKKLEGALTTGNGTEVEDTAKEIRAEHLHLWARFHIERLRLLLSAVYTTALEKNYSAEVEEITGLLNSANDKVKVGEQYTEGDLVQVRELLKSASEKLKALFKKIREG